MAVGRSISKTSENTTWGRFAFTPKLIQVLLKQELFLSVRVTRYYSPFVLFLFNYTGPENWSRNPDWYMCSRGQQQSPIDIKPDKLLYDQFLTPIRIDDHEVSLNIIPPWFKTALEKNRR